MSDEQGRYNNYIEFSDDIMTDEEMLENFNSYFANLDDQGQRTDIPQDSPSSNGFMEVPDRAHPESRERSFFGQSQHQNQSQGQVGGEEESINFRFESESQPETEPDPGFASTTETSTDLTSTLSSESGPSTSAVRCSSSSSNSRVRGELEPGSGFRNVNRLGPRVTNTITVELELFEAIPDRLQAIGIVARPSNRSIGVGGSSNVHDFVVPNSPHNSLNSFGSGSGPASIPEESVSFRFTHSQDSYSGMNIDSPAGSQPQSFSSIPIQFQSEAGSQNSQNAAYVDFDPFSNNALTNHTVQQTQYSFEDQDGDVPM